MGVRRSRTAFLGALGLGSLSLLGSLAVAAPGDASPSAQLVHARGTLSAQRARVDDVRARLEALPARRAVLEARLLSDARALYRMRRGGMLPLASGLEGLLGHVSRMERLERIVRADLDELKRLEADEKALSRQAEQLSSQLAETERQVESLERAQARALEAQLTPSYAPEPVQAIHTRPANDDRVAYGLSVVGASAAPHERFASQRGALALPVSGPTTIQDATRVESEGPGLEFVTRPGAAVRAVAAGRVAFADSYGSYGQLVILDHGDRFYTVYGGHATVEVQVGDQVSKSARLGTAGSAPIYFEVRRGTKTENARAWLGL